MKRTKERAVLLAKKLFVKSQIKKKQENQKG